ncbi:hypothetical protein LCGC14_0466370 [marine sediment metagenome]|uniref:Thymidylate synthase (FAD) n=1 Tax=marine sediment metagenome TaxID=412755 RepID=A0A0F9SWH5_9ZZZZ
MIYQRTLVSKKFGEYRVEIVSPPVAEVHLISHSAYPEDVVHLTTRGYKGIYNFDPKHRYNEYSIDDAFDDIVKTKLQTPLEMLDIVWLLNNVSRTFTHQLVRYRIGTAFVQESMRFFGAKQVYRILYKGEEELFERYANTAVIAVTAYVELIEKGVPSEVARGILPADTLTNIFFKCSFRTLQNVIFPQRLCCQVQPGEWQFILRKMRAIIKEEMGTHLEELLRAPYERGEPCGYRASFDRPCKWQKES